MPPMEWHKKLKEAREMKNNGDDAEAPLIFDCRNDYETSVGIFEGAEPLDTENFRDSWDVFKDKLKDTPKDTPIMTYCTGGMSTSPTFSFSINCYDVYSKLFFTRFSYIKASAA